MSGAHTLNETSAQVILRDGQIELKIITDIPHLVSTLQSDQAWLLGDTDQVMPTNLNASQQSVFIENVLLQNVHLRINAKAIDFENVRIVAAKYSTNADISLQARHDFKDVKDVAISFPKSLGNVHVSVVKPRYKLLAAGDIAHIVL
jgi:hypothetical protein